MKQNNIEQYVDGWISCSLGIDRNDVAHASPAYLEGFDDADQKVFKLNPELSADDLDYYNPDHHGSVEDYSRNLRALAGLAD